jgi:hypothetical protein
MLSVDIRMEGAARLAQFDESDCGLVSCAGVRHWLCSLLHQADGLDPDPHRPRRQCDRFAYLFGRLPGLPDVVCVFVLVGVLVGVVGEEVEQRAA